MIIRSRGLLIRNRPAKRLGLKFLKNLKFIIGRKVQKDCAECTVLFLLTNDPGLIKMRSNFRKNKMINQTVNQKERRWI